MRPTLRLIVGLLIPATAVLGAITLVPTSGAQWLGISVRSWCLFACAPLTSLLLALCLKTGAVAEDDRRC